MKFLKRRNPNTQQGETWSILARLWREYLKNYWGYYAIAVLFMVIAGACSAGMAHLVEPAIDRALDGQDTHFLIMVAFGFFAFSFGRGLATYIQVVILQKIGVSVIEKLQSQMFAALQKIDLFSLNQAGTAQQLSRFSNDVHYLNQAVSKVFTSFGRDVMIIIFMLGLMATKNLEMTILSLIFFPLAIYPVMIIGKKIRKLASSIQSQLGAMMSVLDDSFKGARHVRSFGLEKWQESRANLAFEKARHLSMKATMIRTISHPMMDGMAGLSLALILLWGGYKIGQGSMTKGEFLSFFVAIIGAYQPMRSMSSISGYLQEGMAACERIFGILDEKPRITNAPDAKKLQITKGDIEFKQICFNYHEQMPILKNLNLKIIGGQTTAIVGASGGGKSTILNLIPRLYMAQSGQISVDGQDISLLDIPSYRAQIALVSQDYGLFHVSVRQNILFGKFAATEAEIITAAKKANAHDFIMNLPNGYDSECGELGGNLSGGQKQRILIARAFLKNAPILLLDEPTSSLDSHAEQEIQQSLLDLAKGRTCIMVAHRFSTIKNADMIIFIQNGHVAEQGTHLELMANKAGYFKMASLQTQNS